MKKIGEYTARGVVSETQSSTGLPARVTLFDGRFDTAYRVVKFYIWGSDWGNANGPDVIGKLCTTDETITTGADYMRADANNQIAWAANNGTTESASQIVEGIIDPDNLIVEDLFVFARSVNTEPTDMINYMILLEKYDISDWQGSLAMVRNRSQT